MWRLYLEYFFNILFTIRKTCEAVLATLSGKRDEVRETDIKIEATFDELKKYC